MNKRAAGASSPGDELRHFTNRDDERAIFRRCLDAPEGTPLPMLMFYGVGGVGKTWLGKELRATLRRENIAVPTARLDLDPAPYVGGAVYHQDSGRALAEIRRQLDIPCPGFDLAYAMLRHKQGDADEPLLRGSGDAKLAFDVVVEGGQALANSIPGVGFFAWLIRKGSELATPKFKNSALGKRLATEAGNKDFFDLQSLDKDDIYPLLSARLGADLEEHLPPRAGKACRAVIFIDTFEALRLGVHSEDTLWRREQWVRELYESLSNVLIVVAGQNRIDWEERDGDWGDPACLEQHLLGGLSLPDARTFLHKTGVMDGALQRAVLETCVDADADHRAGSAVGYHPHSLGVCVSAIVAERRRGIEPDPGTFRLRPGDTKAIADRFLKALLPAHAVWIQRLAQTPRFDEIAAREAYSPMPTVEQEHAWETLPDYSFVARSEAGGWWTLHARMRDTLRDHLANDPEAARRGHAFWKAHWSRRSASATDDFAALAWYHDWETDPEAARRAWNGLAENARTGNGLDMATHYRLLNWWLLTGIENHAPDDVLTASALNELGIELCQTSLGVRAGNLDRAIACFEAALRVHTEEQFPQQWAVTQNNLGNAYRNLPSGEREQNLQQAIACYEAALRVHTEEQFPYQWAVTQNNLGNAYWNLPSGDSAQNLQQAIACYEAALRVRTEEQFPYQWAMTQNNLGNAYLYLPSGDRAQNLQQAIACYEAALRVYTEEQFPQDWAMTQNNLGTAYSDLPSGEREQNLQQAITYYEAALRVYTEEQFPQDWALTKQNIGIAYENQGALEAAGAAFLEAARGWRAVGMEERARQAEEWAQWAEERAREVGES